MSSNKKMADSHNITATRRQFTGLLGGSGLLALTGCGGGGTEASAPTPAVPAAPTPTPAPAPAPVADEPSISLLAGDIGSGGNIDGTGIAARFNRIKGVARDVEGNLYLADGGSFTVRKVSAAGVVTTLARLGPLGAVDGYIAQKRLGGLIHDGIGNVYVIDGTFIRKISATGLVTTMVLTFEGAPWNSSSMQAVAMDKANNLYVTSETTVRKIDPVGNVIILAGRDGVQGSSDGKGAAASFYSACGVAVDSVGNVFVTDWQLIRKITPTGEVSTIAGDPVLADYKDGQGSEARFYYPTGIAIDAADNIFVTDGYGVVRRISPSGLVSSIGKPLTFSGYHGQGGGSGDRVFFGIALDPIGRAYVGDGSLLVRIDETGTATKLAGSSLQARTVYFRQSYSSDPSDPSDDGRGAAARFLYPTTLALDAAGNAYVNDMGVRLRKISKEGEVTTLLRASKSVDNYINPLSGVAVDAAGNVYVGQTHFHFVPFGGYYRGGSIVKIAPNGVLTTLWSSSIFSPGRIAVDGSGNVYVSTGSIESFVESLPTVLKISPSGLELSSFNYTIPTRVSFFGDVGEPVAVDGQGNLFLALNNRVRKFNVAGAVVAEYGVEGMSGAVDGFGIAARFSEISGLAVDAAGNLFVADTGNHAIRKISPDGKVSTVVGRLGAVGIALGGLPGSLYRPSGVVVDANGTLFVTSALAVLKVNLPR